jgi:uncharacterized membrane protein YphA (DoxX/SURF4 family)
VNVVLWVVQAVLAAMFVASGLSKLVQSKEQLAGRYAWVDDFSAPTVRFIGVPEVAGGIGLVVPVLAPLAATGLAVLMVLAAAVHVRRREPAGVGVTAVLIALTVFVAWARFGPYSQ